MQVTLRANVGYQIYVDKTGDGTARIEFVCDPTPEQIGNTTAAPGTGLGTSDASLDFTPAAGLHYVKITASGGKTVLVADLSNDEGIPTLDVGASETGTFGTPTDSDWVEVSMVNGTTYQIDVRSVGYPGIDPWIIDIYGRLFAQITRPAGMFGASYAGFFDHDSGPGNAARVVYTATETGNRTRTRTRRPRAQGSFRAPTGQRSPEEPEPLDIDRAESLKRGSSRYSRCPDGRVRLVELGHGERQRPGRGQTRGRLGRQGWRR